MRRKRIANASRAQFLLALEHANIQGSVTRAVQDGRVEVLGLFTTPRLVWIVQVTGVMSRDTYLHVHETRSGELKVVWKYHAPPWRHWVGDEVADSPLNQGDRPETYAAWKRQASDHGQQQDHH